MSLRLFLMIGLAAAGVSLSGVASGAPPSAAPGPAVPAGKTPAVTQPGAPALPAAPAPLIFSYDPKGKPDPFKPFVDVETIEKRKKAAAAKAKALPMSPLQRQPVEAFKLIGIAGDNHRRTAMVIDASGKFYPIAVGTRIGLNNARVVAIRERGVILEEPAKGKRGKGRQFEMKLRREGEAP